MMRGLFRGFIGVVAGIMLCSGAAASEEPRTDDEAAIRAVVESLETAWNAGDGKAFGAPFVEDADFTVWNGMRVRGRQAIAEGHQRLFDTIYKETDLDYSTQSVRFLGPDAAVALAEGKVVKKGPNFPELPFTNVAPLLVLVKQEGQWRIAVFQNTPVMPHAGARPPETPRP